MSYVNEAFDEIKGVSDEGRPSLTDSNTDDEEDGASINIDPSLVIPEGLKKRVGSTDQSPLDVKVQRPALTVAKKHEEYQYETPHKPGFRESITHSVAKKSTCSKKCVRDTLYLRIPILNWLFHYKIAKDLLNDVISGITVAVMHIPQGMAYAMLANLDPIIGIYMAFFPVLIYATFASSRHCSMGTFAVVCIMVGKVVSELSTPEMGDTTTDDPLVANITNGTDVYTPVQVATMVSFAVGVWMGIFGLFQMGSLCVFLSDMLVSGFTTGASIHVLTSQVPKLFGMEITSYQGIFKIPKTWYSILGNILYSNPATMVISLICLFILLLNNEIFKPRLRKITKIPFPIELVVVIGGTLASTYGHLNENFDVEVVGHIPTGLPPPTPPLFELYGKVLISSLTIAIVSYTVSFSMAKIFAKKLDYTVDATQELYALSLGNIVGSMFSCGPIAASLSRSLIQQSVGGATQLASYISCSILILVLLFIGPFFETLPNCVLASIIAVALKGMFLQVSDFFKMWKVSRADALVWLLTFLGVVLLDIDYGLLVGIVVALLLLIVRNQAPTMMILGRVANSDIFLDKKSYTCATEIPGIKICQVMGNLHFANRDSFRQGLMKTTGLNPRNILKWKKKQEKLRKKRMKAEAVKTSGISHVISLEDETKKNLSNGSGTTYVNGSGTVVDLQQITTPQNNLKNGLKTDASLENGVGTIDEEKKDIVNLVIDFSGVSHMDISAALNIAQMLKEYEEAGIAVVFATLLDPLVEVMKKSGVTEELSDEVFFHSVMDAVAFLSPSSIPTTIITPPSSSPSPIPPPPPTPPVPTAPASVAQL